MDDPAPKSLSPKVPSGAPGTATAPGLPPHLEIFQMVSAIWTSRAVYAVARLGLADIFSNGPLTAETAAQNTGTDARSMFRLLRALASRGLFTEVEPRHFALTDLGAALKSGAPGGARATVLTIGGDWQWKAWDHFFDALKTGEPGLRKAFGVGLFEYLAAHPDDSAWYDEAMMGFYSAVGPNVVAAYDFSPFTAVADLGGGTGTLLATILRANERLRGTVFELSYAAPRARETIEKLGLATRCDVVEGDFFKAVPGGYDVYILSHVLHDWNDEQALAILRNCRAAAGKDSRLLIVEAVLPPGDTPHPGKLIDMLMLTVTGGLERNADEYAHLLETAGFKLTRVVPTAIPQSVVEAVPI
jgi:SAM-dependent methyltransferase